MGRGLRLACEQCDFDATLRERVALALEAASEPGARGGAEGTIPAEAGVWSEWSDWLCGECRLPVRVAADEALERLALETTADEAQLPSCPRCGTPLLSFELAQRELAAAARSRLWLDLAAERQALRMLRDALEATTRLRAALARGDCTTGEALADLAQRVTVNAAPGNETKAATRATQLEHTAGLADLVAEIADAADLGAAARLLRTREQVAEGYIQQLEGSTEEEVDLPGVPCPRCGVGHLVHWPFWE
jgi:hypothetical protein